VCLSSPDIERMSKKGASKKGVRNRLLTFASKKGVRNRLLIFGDRFGIFHGSWDDQTERQMVG